MSITGSWLQVVALAWVVVQLDPHALGTVVALPILLRLEFAGGADLIGAGLTASTTGSLAGALAMAARRDPRPPSLLVPAGAMTGALLVVAVAPTVAFALAGFIAVGFAWSAGIASVLATLQTAEPAMTGRVMAIFAAIMLGGTAVGGPIAAALISLAGARAPFVLGALAAAAAAVVAFAAITRGGPSVERDADLDGQAAAVARPQREVAVHGVHDLLDDSEAEPAAARGPVE